MSAQEVEPIMAFATHFYYHLSFSTQQPLIFQVENTRVSHRAYKLQTFQQLTVSSQTNAKLRLSDVSATQLLSAGTR